MNGFVGRRVVGLALVSLCLLVFVGDAQALPGSIDWPLPAGTQVTLQGVMVERTLDGFVFVRSMWAGGPRIAVFTDAAVRPGWTLEIQGYVQTAQGTPVVIAQTVRLYADVKGRASPPPPPWPWPYMVDIPCTDVPPGSNIPAPPDLTAPSPQPTISASEQVVTTQDITTNSTPYGMTNRSLATGTIGIPGLSTTGKLVRTWGRVTSVDSGNTYFYINDGSNLHDGSGNTGVKVLWDWPTTNPPSVDWQVAVTGESETEMQGGNTIRVLRPSSPLNVNTFTPSDTTDPTVSITAPPDGEMHLASGATSAVISGLASDADTGIAMVQVKIDSGEWNTATYNSVTKVWTYTWSNPTSTTIYARATDFAGRHADCSRAVTVTTLSNGVIYVDTNSANALDGANHGGSWSMPYKTVVYALNQASGTKDVWVAKGTYVGCVTMKSNIGLYGGFAGGETYREQRNWHANPTILDGNKAGSVVTAISTSGCRIDGLVIRGGSGRISGSSTYGGGIYCTGSNPAVIANNVVRDCTVSWSGGGVYATGMGVTIAGNVFLSNKAAYGGGVYSSGATTGQIASNSFLLNTGTTNGGGIALYSSTPILSNNLVCYNTGGGVFSWYTPTNSSLFKRNDVYGNSSYQYNWTSSPFGTDISVDPGIPYLSDGDWHISLASQCVNAGDDTAPLPVDTDIDAEPRRNRVIDIGADEASECWRWLTLTSTTQCADEGTSVSLTAHVSNPGPVEGCRVEVSVDAGEIVSVTRDGNIIDLTDGGTQQGPLSTHGITGTDGNVVIVVRRVDPGYVNVTSTVQECNTQISRTAAIRFRDTDPVNLVFVIDSTGSTSGGREMKDGVKATVEYLYSQLTGCGRPIRVAGIKYSSGYAPALLGGPYTYGVKYDFATLSSSEDITAFENWVSAAGPGGEIEYTLDILEYAKDMPEATPGMYIALATDEDADSEDPSYHNPPLYRTTVAADLAAAGCIVFIDPASPSLESYYQPLAVNGGAVEVGSIGTFTFALMRQAIVTQIQ